MKHRTWYSILNNERGGFSKVDLGISSFVIISIILYLIIPPHGEITLKVLYVGLSVAGFIVSLLGGYFTPPAMLAAIGAAFLVRFKDFNPYFDVILPWITYLAILTLFILLERTADSKEQKKIKLAIQKVKEAEAAGDLAALRKALSDNPVDARDRAKAAIVRLGGQAAIETLIAAGLYHDAIEHFGDDAAKHLLKLVESDNVKDMRYAVLTLGEIGEERVLERVLAYKQDDAGYIRENVVKSLGAIGGQRAMEALAGMVEDEGFYVRKSVASILGNLGGQQSLNLLSVLAKDSDWRVREVAAESYGKIGGAETLKALVNLGLDDELAVRKKVKIALEGLGTTGGLEAAAKVDLAQL